MSRFVQVKFPARWGGGLKARLDGQEFTWTFYDAGESELSQGRARMVFGLLESNYGPDFRFREEDISRLGMADHLLRRAEAILRDIGRGEIDFVSAPPRSETGRIY